MPRLRSASQVISLAAAVMVLLASSAFSAADGCAQVAELQQVRDRHLTLLNALRKRHGLGVLTPDARLDQVALDYACLLAGTGHFGHTGPDGSTLAERVKRSGYRFCVITENLASGQQTVDRALMDWISSPGHWQNLQQRDVTEVGFGVAFPVEEPLPPQQPGERTLTDIANEYSTVPQPVPRRPQPYVWVEVFGRPCPD